MAEGGGSVLEGFLCPVCKADFGTAVKLLSHFEKEHNEDKDVLQAFKDLFGKAKKKILKSDGVYGNEGEIQASSRKVMGYSPSLYEPQPIGAVRSHSQQFSAVRSQHLEHYTVETNKLLIRLDKILKDLPSDPLKRKAHEQEVVPWVDEKMVRLCPSCSRSFHLTRRKHHCRLCGFVMCNDCSYSLALDTARKMTSPISQVEPQTELQGSSLPSQKLKRSNSNSSLNSVLSLVEGVHQIDTGLRVCKECLHLLESREALRESRAARPILIQFYERLRTYMQDANQFLPTYIKMCNSISCGESTYQLKEAQALWAKLLRLAENIDSLSKKILVLGSADTENPPRGRALQLQQQIRAAATAFLRNEMLGLPTLPTEAKYLEMQEQRRQELKARIQQEQLEAQASLQLQKQKVREKGRDKQTFDRNHVNVHQDTVLLDSGWTPEKARLFNSDDPMVQQMNNLKHYIKEAKLAQRVDEVEALERNLEELQEEYWRQQEQKRQETAS
ncbi:rabenosyn-5 [Frankliniella occidentalis]|uniref:Rabenosyn-5 n=1 Tax=Frankliniella occidentalis TaxID=133901 RepID=A0A6J1S591_FRAOC|nr:rabenosyn-5 [Frankliniella occidentalis]